MEYRHSVDPNALEIVWNHANEALFIFDYEGNIFGSESRFCRAFWREAGRFANFGPLGLRIRRNAKNCWTC